MELAFIYVDDHKVLKGINANVNSGFEGSYSNEVLSLKRVEKDVAYYNGVLISAIIGKNGVGKSTLLDFIESFYSYGDSSGIIVWFDSEKYKYHICTNNFYLDFSKIIIDCEHKGYVDTSKIFLEENNINLVKLSNLTNIDRMISPVKAKKNKLIHDLSLSEYSSSSKKIVTNKLSNFMRFFSDSYSIFEGKRPRIEFTFKFGVSLFVKVKSILKDVELLKKWELNSEDVEALSFLEGRFEAMKGMPLESLHGNEDNWFKYLLDVNILNVIEYAIQGKGFGLNRDRKLFALMLIAYVKGELTSNTVYQVVKKYSLNRNDEDIAGLDGAYVASRYERALDGFREMSNIITHFSSNINYKYDGMISTESIDSILEVVAVIQKIPAELSKTITYGWNGLSTGEFAKVSLFSELYGYASKFSGDQDTHHVIIMDEVDLYLHPEWQRTFLEEIISLSKKSLPENNFQIVLTSHSPIIIGDFLPEDIVSLKKNENGATEVVDSVGFGTRVGDLFLDGMHLKSTFGEHSRRVIEGIQANTFNNELTSLDKSRISKMSNRSIQNMLLGSHDKT